MYAPLFAVVAKVGQSVVDLAHYQVLAVIETTDSLVHVTILPIFFDVPDAIAYLNS